MTADEGVTLYRRAGSVYVGKQIMTVALFFLFRRLNRSNQRAPALNVIHDYALI